MLLMHSLTVEYQNQYRFRNWNTAYNHLPDLKGKTVLDLGCGPGDQSKDLASRGAHVIGVDSNKDFLTAATNRNIPNAQFIEADLRTLPEDKLSQFNGIWGSFVAAYFTDLEPVLKHWSQFLKPGGWIALTEISGLFDHDPLSAETKTMIQNFYKEWMIKSYYDFNSGLKLRRTLANSGFKILKEEMRPDLEFSTNGPLSKEAVDSWTARLNRMKGLKDFFGQQYPAFEKEFLECLTHHKHQSHCKVTFIFAIKE